MKHFKKVFTAAASAVIGISMILNAAAANITYSDKLTLKKQSLIGTPGTAVNITNGSFTDSDGNTVSFGEGRRWRTVFDDAPYPILKTTFISEDLDCTLLQFADVIHDGNGNEYTVVYSRLSAKNETEKAAAFPTVSASLTALSVPPTEVEAGEEAECSYAAALNCNDTAPDASVIKAHGSFDDRLTHMKAFWDLYISEKDCFGGGSVDSDIYDAYRTAVINDAICSGVSDISVYDGRQTSLEGAMQPFTVWLLTQKNGSLPENAAEIYDLTSGLDGICEKIRTEGDAMLYFGTNGAPASLKENLEALTQLAAALEIAPLFGLDDTEKYKDTYNALIKGIENNLLTDVSEEKLADTETAGFIGELYTAKSATALCSWYIKCGAMGRLESGKLSYLAREAFKYAEITSPIDFALAVVQPMRDFGICIGRGICAKDFDSNIAVTGFDKSGVPVHVEFSCSEREISIKIDTSSTEAVKIAVPCFKDNIEKADCTFDDANGTLTPAVGTKTVNLTLKKSAHELSLEYAAKAALEIAIEETKDVSTEGCTDISRREFEAARKNAIAARSMILTTDEVLEDAKALQLCLSQLSRLTSGYTYKSVSDSTPCGSITAKTVVQSFTLPKDGQIDTLTVYGTADGNPDAEIYEKDSYYNEDTAKPIATAKAGSISEDSISFNFDAELSADTDYVAVISSGIGTVTLSAAETDKNEAVTAEENGDIVVYDSAAVDMEIEIVQADRQDLDAFYEKCQSTDVSRYTRESVKKLQTAMRTAADLLRTPDAEKDECDEALEALYEAFSSLSTYASDDKLTSPSPVLYILIGVTIVLLCSALAAASAAEHKKMKKK